MTFVNPFQSAPAPLVPNLPNATTALVRKYDPATIQLLQSRYSPKLVNSLLDYETKRAARGIQPISGEATIKALSTAMDKKPATQSHKRDPLNIFGNIASDVTEIVSSIPRLPATMYREGQALTDLPNVLAEAGGNPAKILQAPGIRLIPGAYTASNLLSGNIGEIVSHPVMTTLDVLPYAEKFHLGARLGQIPVPGEAANLAELTRRGTTALGDTTVGQLAKQAWAPKTRRLSSILAEKAAEATSGSNPALDRIFTDDVSALRREASVATMKLRQAAGEGFGDLDALAKNAAENGTINQLLASLPADQAAALHDILDVSARYDDLLTRRGDLVHRTMGGVDETLTTTQAARLDKVVASRDAHALMVDIRKSILDPQNADLVDLHSRVSAAMDLPTTLRTKRNIYNGYIHALDQAGYQTPRLSPLKQSTISAEMAKLDPASLPTRGGGLIAKTYPGTAGNSSHITATQEGTISPQKLKTFEGASGEIRGQHRNMQGAQWTAFVDDVRQNGVQKPIFVTRDYGGKFKISEGNHRLDAALEAGLKSVPVEVRYFGTAEAQGMLDASEPVKTMRANSAQRWLSDNRAFTDKSLNRYAKAVERAEANIVPARWQPLIEQGVNERVADAVRTRIPPTDPNLPEALRLSNDRAYSVMKMRGLISDADLALWEKEAIEATQQMKAAGVDPVFVHHVSPGQAATMESPTLSSVVPKPSQLRGRINDWTPTVPSLTIAVGHQGLELARQAAARAGVEAIRDTFTVPASQAVEEMTPVARRVAERRGTSFGEEMERLMSRRYVRWSETENGFVAGSAKPPKFSELNNLGPDEKLIPRYLSDSLMRISSPSPISRVFDPALKVFRYSVLPFSPRFQINNIGGGAIMSALEEPRVFRQIAKGWDFAKSNYKLSRALARGDSAASLPAHVADILENMPPEMRAQFGSLEYSATSDIAASSKSAQNLFKLKSGSQQGKMFLQSMMQRGKSLADASFHFNQLFDDMYRAAAYFEGETQGLRKGATAADAARAGMELANKIQPRWLEMTPFERSIIRPFVPFYAFMSHVFRYAFRFPIDHPWRASVMAGLARAEMEDYSSGLPQLLGGAFFLGGMDDKGNQKAIDLGGMNPFRNLGDDMTLAGFASELNPVMKLALQQLGYDPQSQGPELYPELEFDPQTGGMRVRQQNALSQLQNVVTGFIPQASIPLSLLGTSSEFNALMQSNPGAAHRMLLSSAGIPMIYKNVNVPQTYFKGELARQEDQRQVLSDAMKTGDWSRAMQYPELAPYASQLQKLQASGSLTNYASGREQEIAQALTR